MPKGALIYVGARETRGASDESCHPVSSTQDSGSFAHVSWLRGCRGDHPYGDAVIKIYVECVFSLFRCQVSLPARVSYFSPHLKIFGRYTFRRAVRSLALPPPNAMSTTTPERVSPRTSLNGLYTQPVDALSFEAVDPVNHPPNKASQWTIDPELMSFRLMHNAIRAEATKFESLLFKLGDRALAAWEIDAIKVRDGDVPRTVAHTFLARFPARAPRQRARENAQTLASPRARPSPRARLHRDRPGDPSRVPRPTHANPSRDHTQPRETSGRPRRDLVNDANTQLTAGRALARHGCVVGFRTSPLEHPRLALARRRRDRSSLIPSPRPSPPLTPSPPSLASPSPLL